MVCTFLVVTRSVPAAATNTGSATRRSCWEKLLVIGRYPAVSLKSARLVRDEARNSLLQGRDLSQGGAAGQAGGCRTRRGDVRAGGAALAPVADARWKPVHLADVIESPERDISRVIGAYAGQLAISPAFRHPLPALVRSGHAA